jgi:hypothetical protein
MTMAQATKELHEKGQREIEARRERIYKGIPLEAPEKTKRRIAVHEFCNTRMKELNCSYNEGVCRVQARKTGVIRRQLASNRERRQRTGRR